MQYLRSSRCGPASTFMQEQENSLYNSQQSNQQANLTAIEEDIRTTSSLISKSDVVPDKELSDFEIKMQIGRGGYGRVFLAELKGTNEMYAIKSIRKDKILHMVDKVKLEKDILF